MMGFERGSSVRSTGLTTKVQTLVSEKPTEPETGTPARVRPGAAWGEPQGLQCDMKWECAVIRFQLLGT